MKKQIKFRTPAILKGSLVALMLFALISNSLMAQCDNCPPGSTYSGVFPATSVNLSGYHPCLAINGIYDVDEDVTITSSFIFLGPDAQIRVQSGATLTLNDCTVSGCNAMWARLLVNSGGILVADNCDIGDGIDGIDARGNSELTIKNCTFTDNYIGLHLRNKFGPSGIVFTEPLSNNIFQTVGTLLPPNSGEMGYAGIKAKWVAPVNIGEAGYPQNQFINIANGIVTENSRVVVTNALFQSLSSIDDELMTGISATGGTVDVVGSTFNRCFVGVSSSTCNLTATGNTFSSVITGFEVTNSANRRVRITGNVLTNTKLVGVSAADNGVFQEFLVRDNKIEMDFSAPIIAPIAAIRLRSAVSVTQTHAVIDDNNPINLYGSNEGIQVMLNKNTDILDNYVEIFHAFGLSPLMEHGINLLSSGNSSIIGNSVVAFANGPSSEIHAIELNDSEKTIVCSNFVDGSDIGFKFDGQNPNTYFSNNSINDHRVGLYIGGDLFGGGGIVGYIGKQGPNNKARDNHWNGSYLEWGAQNFNADQQFVQQSEFSVRNSSQPQMPPSISATAQWFDDDGTGYNYGCPMDELANNLTAEFEKSIADGSVPFTNYAEAQLWRAQFTLYGSMKENPDMLGQGAVLDSFYNIAASGTIGAFYSVTEGINGLVVPDAQTWQEYGALEDGISTKMGELCAIDAQLLMASGTAYDALVGQRRTVSKIIDSLHQEVLVLDSIMLDAQIARADQLAAQNAAITTANLPQHYLKAVNDVYLNTVAIGIMELTTSQIQVLQPIASTCIYEGGDAVLGARLLLEMAGDSEQYDDGLLCQPTLELMAPPHDNDDQVAQASEVLALLPNPAKGWVAVVYPAVEGKGVLEVYDQQGVLKHSALLADGQVTSRLPLEGFPSGMYIVTINSNSQILTEKLAVLK